MPAGRLWSAGVEEGLYTKVSAALPSRTNMQPDIMFPGLNDSVFAGLLLGLHVMGGTVPANVPNRPKIRWTIQELKEQLWP